MKRTKLKDNLTSRVELSAIDVGDSCLEDIIYMASKSIIHNEGS